MTPEKSTPTSETTPSIDSQENVITSIVVKTAATVAIGIIAWYFLQTMI